MPDHNRVGSAGSARGVPDQLNTDGSCTPNPGGRMIVGWVISWAAGHVQTGQHHEAAAQANTVNVAEYLGVQCGLDAYVAAGGTGPLVVKADSQLIIRQLALRYQVRGNLLVPYQATCALAARVPGGVRWEWIRREENTAADLLTHDADATPLPECAARTFLQPVVAPQPLAAQIQRLNTHPGPSFGDLLALRLGGTDAYSALRLPELIALLPPAQGLEARAALTRAFPDLARQAAALRWAMRGLALELAIAKGRVDGEVAASSARRTRQG